MYIIFITTGPELIVAFLSAVTVLHNGTVCVKPFYYTVSMVGVFYTEGQDFTFLLVAAQLWSVVGVVSFLSRRWLRVLL